MSKKTKDCFNFHIWLHTLLGFGLGILLATGLPILRSVWFGLALVVGAVVTDVLTENKNI